MEKNRIRPLDVLAYAAPFVVILILLAIYLLAPQFYLTYVLELRRRESQAVELITVAYLALALVPLSWATKRLWRMSLAAHGNSPDAPSDAVGRFLHRFGAAAFVSMILLATVFFLGEEINWGQTVLLWLDPGRALPVQTNVHNNIPGISVQGLGSIGMACAFFVAPLLWLFRDRIKLPETLAPAIAEGPVISCLAVAMAWKWFKNVYASVAGTARENAFYWGFVEQINEQKELLVAMSLMLYAFYRVAAVRARSFERPVTAPEPQLESELMTAGRK